MFFRQVDRDAATPLAELERWAIADHLGRSRRRPTGATGNDRNAERQQTDSKPKQPSSYPSSNQFEHVVLLSSTVQ